MPIWSAVSFTYSCLLFVFFLRHCIFFFKKISMLPKISVELDSLMNIINKVALCLTSIQTQVLHSCSSSSEDFAQPSREQKAVPSHARKGCTVLLFQSSESHAEAWRWEREILSFLATTVCGDQSSLILATLLYTCHC